MFHLLHLSSFIATAHGCLFPTCILWFMNSSSLQALVLFHHSYITWTHNFHSSRNCLNSEAMSYHQAWRRDGKREHSLSLSEILFSKRWKFMDPERARFCNFMASENSVKEGDDKHFLSKWFLLCFQCPFSVKFPTGFRSRTQQPLTLPDQHWLLEHGLPSLTLAPIRPFCSAAQQESPARLGLSEQR